MMPSIDPGAFNRRLRFERQSQGASSFQQQVWSLVAEVWGSVRPVLPREQVLADAMQASLTHTVMVRRSAMLAMAETAAWRITYNDLGRARILAVAGPARDMGAQWMIFDCIEGLADGH